MGLFVTLDGDFECVRCGYNSERSIQTKLLRTAPENSCHPHRVGDTEIIDGLDDYAPLFAWYRTELLVVVVGDWGCPNCQLNWQWAKVVFNVNERNDVLDATIASLSGFQPYQPNDLIGVHYLEFDLAALSDATEKWGSLTIESRCDLVASGYRSWCAETAGIHPNS
jgi:hypothetical protein